MYGYNGKSIGYFPSFWGLHFFTKWLVYACMVAYANNHFKEVELDLLLPLECSLMNWHASTVDFVH